MSSLLQDLRYAVRRLWNTPLFTLSAAVILAAGIGLNAAVFNLVDATLFRPAPVADPDRVVHVYQDSDDGRPAATSFPAYRDMAAETDVFSDVAAVNAADAIWDTADGPQRVAVEYATASYFAVLGLAPSRGRWFGREHDDVGADMVAVVSHRAWRTRFGADPDVVGRTVRLNNQSITIIGVGPVGFNGQAGAVITDFWLSISSTPIGGTFRVANLERRQDHWYQVVARLAPGVGLPRAQAAMDALARRHAEAYPDLDAGRGITVFAYDDVRFHPMVDDMVFASTASLLVLAALVLLLACSNLANLFLVRGMTRGPEMAVRAALGAGWTRVARLLLVEALLLAALGGAGGLAVAAWSVGLWNMLPLDAPNGGIDVRFDHRLVVYGALAALVTGVLFGLAPALRTARGDVSSMLRDEGRSLSAGARLSWLRGGLVAAQVALSVVLVVATGLMARSLANAERVDVGVDAERIAVIGTNLARGGVPQDEVRAVTARILERVSALPGVERAAVTTRLPVQPRGFSTTTIIEGYTPRVGTEAVELPVAFVSREYFPTMGIALLSGRTFAATDHADAPIVAVVNEAAAGLYWTGSEPVGGRVRPQDAPDAWRQVVGVVADVKVADVTEPPTPMIYYPIEQLPSAAFSVVARTSGDSAVLGSALRHALTDVRPSLPVISQFPLDEHVTGSLDSARTLVSLLNGFSLLALVLAAVGIYAAVSFTVERRAHEIGIRVALGATYSRLVAMVFRQTLWITGIGLALGLGAAALAARGLQGLLFGVAPIDPFTFMAAAAVLLVTACTAAFLPARRAAKGDPVDALRAQ
ncbi:MAG: ABC transporter permease [Gammaproteobacteria bacterium]|nr:ABC transporter permease [Gammaproteobacteria bacterium]